MNRKNLGKKIDKLEERVRNEPIEKSLFEVEYNIAINNGHPNHDDAVKYVTEKIIQDKINQYKILKENNINLDYE